MAARFEFLTPGRVVFGAGALDEVGAATRSLGRSALVVRGRSAARVAQLDDLLTSAGVAATPFVVAGEPDTALVTRGATIARAAGVDVVVGIGGGSVIDAAKAVAALATNDGDVLEYLEVIGRGQPLERPALPVVAIPTTAGTGSEATRNAVLTSPGHRVKVSLRSPSMMPRVAVVDPLLTTDLPPALTASTGLDALTQLIEAYVSSRATPMTDALAIAGIPRAARALPRACTDGRDRAAREDMALASLWSGMALANAGLGAVHGFAGPIGGLFHAPHGAVCAALLPHVFSANARALERRAPDALVRERFDEVSRWLTGHARARWTDGAAWLRQLTADLGIPPLGAHGVRTADLADLADKAARASSMKGNPIVLTHEELMAALAAAI